MGILSSNLITCIIIQMVSFTNSHAKNIKIIAHRGASNIFPENTIKAFQKAKDLKTDFIELDVHLSSSKIPIVVHDLEFVEQYSSEVTVSEKMSNILKGEKIPTLLEVLLAFLDVDFMIEIKHGSASDFDLAFETLKVIEKAKHKKIKIGSFSPLILHEVYKINPSIGLIGIICDKNINFLKDFIKLKVEIIAAKESIINLDFIKLMQQLNKKIWVWTVDDKKTIKKLTSYNIDGLITNDVALAKSVLN